VRGPMFKAWMNFTFASARLCYEAQEVVNLRLAEGREPKHPIGQSSPKRQKLYVQRATQTSCWQNTSV
jgi:hypothetical protein